MVQAGGKTSHPSFPHAGAQGLSAISGLPTCWGHCSGPHRLERKLSGQQRSYLPQRKTASSGQLIETKNQLADMTPIIQTGQLKLVPGEVGFLSPVSQQTPDGQRRQLPGPPRMTGFPEIMGGLPRRGWQVRLVLVATVKCGVVVAISPTIWRKQPPTRERSRGKRSLRVFQSPSPAASLPSTPNISIHFSFSLH